LATTLCPICKTTAVRLATEKCKSCRERGGKPISDPIDIEPGLPVPELEMEAHEPARILEKQMRQAQQSQGILQSFLDNPVQLFCVSCAENPMATEQVALAWTLEQQVKLGKVLSGIVPVWAKLHEGVIKDVESYSREQMLELFIRWFGRLPQNVQRDVLQGMTRIHNEAAPAMGVYR
jgi:hypothetical protein